MHSTGSLLHLTSKQFAEIDDYTQLIGRHSRSPYHRNMDVRAAPKNNGNRQIMEATVGNTCSYDGRHRRRQRMTSIRTQPD